MRRRDDASVFDALTALASQYFESHTIVFFIYGNAMVSQKKSYSAKTHHSANNPVSRRLRFFSNTFLYGQAIKLHLHIKRLCSVAFYRTETKKFIRYTLTFFVPPTYGYAKNCDIAYTAQGSYSLSLSLSLVTLPLLKTGK